MNRLGKDTEDLFEETSFLRERLREYLKRTGWVKLDEQSWQLNTGPGRWISCSSLGTAIDVQIELELKGERK